MRNLAALAAFFLIAGSAIAQPTMGPLEGRMCPRSYTTVAPAIECRFNAAGSPRRALVRVIYVQPNCKRVVKVIECLPA